MTDKVFDNNQVNIAGEVLNQFVFSHEVFGEGFFLVDVSVSRLSNSNDIIPIMVSERLINVKKDLTGKKIEVNGQFRSYNRHEKNKNRLVLSVFAHEIRILKEAEDLEGLRLNDIYLDGFICKQPVYRKTPLGREIADLLIAVNRPYGKSDYIPVICWGRNARYAQNLRIGDHLNIGGRIQSRQYKKRIGEDKYESRIAYEISVSKLECLNEA